MAREQRGSEEEANSERRESDEGVVGESMKLTENGEGVERD